MERDALSIDGEKSDSALIFHVTPLHSEEQLQQEMFFKLSEDTAGACSFDTLKSPKDSVADKEDDIRMVMENTANALRAFFRMTASSMIAVWNN